MVAFLFGLAIGSFLNVCIYRIPAGLSLVHPPSRCPACETPVRPVDNVPLLSFLLLKGKCRSCGAPISWRYPAVEALTGVVFVLLYARFGMSINALAGIFFASVVIVVSFIDLDTERIPNKVILPAIAAGAALIVPDFVGYKILPLVGGGALHSIAGFFVGGGSLLIIALAAPLFFKKDAMGGGDIKLAAFIGLFLGVYSLLALFFSFLIGAIAGVFLLARGSRGRSDTIPFGPYLAIGAIIVTLGGPELWRFYLAASGLA
ncbi:MAG: prepilin peptidase [Chloroflexi bacterium]|nr:prepilin peptidase [Chloroflexota bacterium]